MKLLKQQPDGFQVTIEQGDEEAAYGLGIKPSTTTPN